MNRDHDDVKDELSESLAWFEIESLEQITLEELKRRFKKSLAVHHPDRGGKEGDFEKIVDAYEYISAILKRMMGGRDQYAVLDVQDIIKQRDRDFVHEMNNMISDVFDELERGKSDNFHIIFNEAFEKKRQEFFMDHDVDRDPLTPWNDIIPQDYIDERSMELSKKFDEQLRIRTEEEQMRQEEDHKESLSFQEAMSHFVKEATERRSDSSQKEYLILHPMEMAVVDGRCYGTDIIRRENRHYSSMFVRPEYTDLSGAYSSDNVVYDKLPDYTEHAIPSMEEIIKERERIYECVADDHMKHVQEYEQRYVENESKHVKEIQSYFSSTKSSQWALKNNTDPVENVYDYQLGVKFPSCDDIRRQREEEKKAAMLVEDGDEKKDISAATHEIDTDSIIQRIIIEMNK
jgi:hypothetical protein